MRGKMTKVEQLRREVMRLRFRKDTAPKQFRKAERARNKSITRLLSVSKALITDDMKVE